MAIKSDKWIKKMSLGEDMITPFVDGQIAKNVISYGVSSYGYDLRVADEYKIFTNVNNSIIDPKNFDSDSFVDFKGEVCIVPPNSFALARSVEYFRIPRDVLTICVGKSTYARCGIIVNVTPFEPEWEGHVTLEISIICDPCSNLYTLPYVGAERGPAFIKTLMNRRGWYARVLTPGTIKSGDSVTIL